MPEMPEVEIVRKTLNEIVLGKIIKEVKVWYPNIIIGDSESFSDQLKEKQIIKIDRYAKFLLFRLSDNLTIVSHLRMEGKYRLASPQDAKDKHDHVEFIFTDGTSLRYNDVRKFGRMQLIRTGTEKEKTGIKKLGPEALSDDFTLSYFKQALKNKKKNIKATLLDQDVVSGLGNIYVDETLWLSKIYPERPANSLADNEIKKLYLAINQVISQAIKERGTTVHTFLDAEGQTGGYQKYLKVYGRAGEKCFRCGNVLQKTKVAGRGTTFCPKCQEVK